MLTSWQYGNAVEVEARKQQALFSNIEIALVDLLNQFQAQHGVAVLLCILSGKWDSDDLLRCNSIER
jgi:hypothetical protein